MPWRSARSKSNFQRRGVRERWLRRALFSSAAISEHAANKNGHSGASAGLVPDMFFGELAKSSADHALAPGAEVLEAGSARICTRFALPKFVEDEFAQFRLTPAACLASMLAEGIPVFA